MIEYVILGTSHCIQDSSNVQRPVADAIRKHAITLVAEEYPLDTTSQVQVMTRRLHIPYLQIDLFPDEWRDRGIDREMSVRKDVPSSLRGKDVRLMHADAVREEFWLAKIEACVETGRVLVICGYLHSDFLAQRIRDRDGRVREVSAFPADLLGRKPELVLSQTELEEYLRKAEEG